MASENSFDIVSKIEMQEIKNAIEQAMKEVAQRFDFKGSKSEIKLEEKNNEILVSSDDEYKLKSLLDILQSKLVKRGISLKALTYERSSLRLAGQLNRILSYNRGSPLRRQKRLLR